jgi:hypothetical protein
MNTITVRWIERVDIGYNEFWDTDRTIDFEWEGPIDAEVIAKEVERRVDVHGTDYRRIEEIRDSTGNVVWESA